jgi:small subunit ribosomal protein S7
MVEEKAPEQEAEKTQKEEAPPAAAAPPAPPPSEVEDTKDAPEREPAQDAEEEDETPLWGNVLLFGRFDVSEVAVRDEGIARYVDVSPIAVPHTGGKHTSKPFGKAKMSIVERLINGMMRTEDFTGKKIKSYKAVENSFVIIEKKTGKNPLQTLVDAIENAAPREEVTRLQYGGISVPKAVDVAPARRVDLALRYICRGALESSHKSTKPIEECLADEVIAAAKNDVNSFSIAKKEEIERVSSSAR